MFCIPLPGVTYMPRLRQAPLLTQETRSELLQATTIPPHIQAMAFLHPTPTLIPNPLPPIQRSQVCNLSTSHRPCLPMSGMLRNAVAGLGKGVAGVVSGALGVAGAAMGTAADAIGGRRGYYGGPPRRIRLRRLSRQCQLQARRPLPQAQVQVQVILPQ